MNQLLNYILQVLLAIDQLANTLTGGLADETLSSRAWRTEQKGRFFGKLFRPLIDTVFFFQKNHCNQSYLAEVYRRQLPDEFSKR